MKQYIARKKNVLSDQSSISFHVGHWHIQTINMTYQLVTIEKKASLHFLSKLCKIGIQRLLPRYEYYASLKRHPLAPVRNDLHLHFSFFFRWQQ